MASLCDGEEDSENATVSTGNGPGPIEDVEGRSADSKVSEDLTCETECLTVYFFSEVVEDGAGCETRERSVGVRSE